jgi:uncharacterized membrane protein
MVEFWLSLGAFMASHMIISRTRLRPRLIEWFGERFYYLGYSMVSLVMMGWVIVAAIEAPQTPLWPWIHGLYWVPNLLMPFSFILLISGFLVPNPVSISVRKGDFDSQRPPFTLALTRHPILWGFFLWSFSHIVPNGDYPLVLMFGIFAFFALVGTKLLDRKKKRTFGEYEWRNKTQYTPIFLCAGSGLYRGQFVLTKEDIWGIVTGLIVYCVFYYLHGHLFGIIPTPPL